MARIKTGPIVSDIAGKVGDNIFSRNAGGPYVKQYAVPNIPGSTYVTTARTAMKNASDSWLALSEFDRLEYAKFSENYPRSSFVDGYHKIDPRAFFISNYINQVFAGITPNPQISNPDSFAFEGLSISMPDCLSINFKLNGGVNSSDYRVIYYAFQPVSKAVMSLNTVPQYVFHSADYVADANVNLKTEYLTRFFNLFPSENEKLFGSVRIIHAASGIQVGFGHNRSIGTANFLFTTYGNGGTKVSTLGGGSHKATKITVPAAGTITSLTWDLLNFSQDIRFAIYDDNAGVPGNLLGQSQVAQANAIDTTYDIILSSPIVVPSAGTYWVAVAGGTSTVVYRQFGSGNSSISTKSGLSFFPTWTQSSGNTDRFQGRLQLRTFVSSCIDKPLILGNDTIGVTLRGSNKSFVIPIIPPSNGQIDSITFYHSATAGTIELGVYDQLASEPKNLIATTGSVASIVSLGWQTINLTSPLSVLAGTTYYIGFARSPAIDFYSGSIGSTSLITISDLSSLPNPWPAGTLISIKPSIYANLSYP